MCTNPWSLSAGRFQIQNRVKKLCLEAAASDAALKTNLPCDGLHPLRSFTFVWSDLTMDRGLLALLGTNTCVDAGPPEDPGWTALRMRTCRLDYERQLWAYDQATGRVTSVYKSLCIDDFVKYQFPYLWRWEGNENQAYDLVPVEGMQSMVH